jgi:hypothetical protein
MSNTVIHCPTKIEFEQLITKENIGWPLSYWDIYKKQMCVYIEDKTYQTTDYFKRNGYQIITFQKYSNLEIIPLIFN